MDVTQWSYKGSIPVVFLSQEKSLSVSIKPDAGGCVCVCVCVRSHWGDPILLSFYQKQLLDYIRWPLNVFGYNCIFVLHFNFLR